MTSSVSATGKRAARQKLVTRLTCCTRGARFKGGGRLEIDLAVLNASCVVADLVYVPLVTPRRGAPPTCLGVRALG
jgi:hypothetical protein